MHPFMIWKVKNIKINYWVWSISNLLINMVTMRLKILIIFSHIGMHKLETSCFHFDGNHIFDIDGDSKAKIAKLLF